VSIGIPGSGSSGCVGRVLSATRRSASCTRCCCARHASRVARRHATSAHLRGGDQDDLAQQSADDALVAILGKLDDFRGESRFTTWAYKFALYAAAAKVRKRAWQGREIPLKAETLPLIADDHRRTLAHGAETR
jgi:DNA-directed RNA polymerase specialized sigma24 family protein